MRKAALWLAAAGSIAYLGALGIHAAHSAPFPTWPCSQCRGGWVDAMTGMCPDRPSCKIKVSTEVGKVTEPAPTAWKLRVTIFNKDGSPKDIMVMVNPDHTPWLWLSLDACNAFMDTDEYKKSLPPLADYLVAQGYDLDDGLTFTCVPAQPTLPLVQ